MCQLTSPSLKIVLELPSTAGISNTATNSASGERRGGEPAASSATAARARPLSRPAAVDRVEHKADHLRRQEEQLSAVRKADEEIEAAEDSNRSDDPGERR